MGKFEEIANKLVIHKIKASWLTIEKFYNEEASKQGVSISVAFVLMAINNEKGSPVTSIAPRIGMEPNSLSRILKSMIEKEFIYKKKSTTDKRKVYICLTEKGTKMQKIVLEKMFHLEKSLNQKLKPSDLNGFFNVIEQLNESISILKKNS